MGQGNLRRGIGGAAAANLDANEELVLAMNAKLNALLDEEVGVEEGSSLGLDEDTDNAFTKVDI